MKSKTGRQWLNNESGIHTFLITTGISIATGIAGWFVSKKRSEEEIIKLKSEINGNELDNVEKAVKIWRDLAEDLTQKLKSITERCVKLEEQLSILSTENKALRKKYHH